MSFAVHRRADDVMVSAVRDEDILPDAGATNPYRLGARRHADNRQFKHRKRRARHRSR